MLSYQTIFENNNFLVINKPAGLLIHGADHIKEPTLADQLLKKHPKLAKIGEDPSRPGIIHRLDRQVSGLLVITKTQEAFDRLKKQFKARVITKVYTALVYGQIIKDEDEITFSIQRSSKRYKMAALPTTYKGELRQEGRRAITEFEVIKKFINYTLLKIKIKTGRTHQIRVHMAAYGHPIVGDDLYGTKKTREKNKKLAPLLKIPELNLNRLFLVASELSFSDLSGNKLRFKISLPEDLNVLLKQIK